MRNTTPGVHAAKDVPRHLRKVAPRPSLVRSRLRRRLAFLVVRL